MKTKDELHEVKTALLAQHKKVRTLEVPLDEDDDSKIATLFLKKPDKDIRNMIGTLANKPNTPNSKIIEATLKALYIGGDDLNLVLSNDDAFAACDEALSELLSVQKAVLKKIREVSKTFRRG